MAVTRIFIADPHVILREYLREILNSRRDMKVIGEASNGITALEQIKRLRPDVIIVDMEMPELDGIELTRVVRQSLPQVVIIMLAPEAREAQAKEAVAAGASAWLLRSSPTSRLLSLLCSACRKAKPGRKLYRRPRKRPGLEENRHRWIGRYQLLTRREREVFKLLIQGKDNRRIAEILGISVKTVENHRASVKNKLRVKDLLGLIRLGVRLGLVDLKG